MTSLALAATTSPFPLSSPPPLIPPQTKSKRHNQPHEFPTLLPSPPPPSISTSWVVSSIDRGCACVYYYLVCLGTPADTPHTHTPTPPQRNAMCSMSFLYGKHTVVTVVFPTKHGVFLPSPLPSPAPPLTRSPLFLFGPSLASLSLSLSLSLPLSPLPSS